MRKLLFTLFFYTTIIFSSQAQVGKGAWLLGGTMSFSNGMNRDPNADTIVSKYNSINISPQVGYFLTKNLVIGISPVYNKQYSRRTESSLYPIKNNRSSYSIGPFVRYYHPLGQKWMVFGHFTGINYFNGKSYDELPYYSSPTTNSDKWSGYQVGVYVTPGITYFVSPKVGIEASLGTIGYSFIHTKHKINRTWAHQGEDNLEVVEKSSNANMNLSSLLGWISIGVQFYVGGKPSAE